MEPVFTMVAIPITAFYASLLAVFMLFLSIQVIIQRRESKVSLGAGEDRHMLQMMRAHANFIEYVPFCLVLMLVAELNQASSLLLHIVGWTLLIARFLHAYGVRHHYGASWQRFVGALFTFLCILALIGINLWPMYNL